MDWIADMEVNKDSSDFWGYLSVYDLKKSEDYLIMSKESWGYLRMLEDIQVIGYSMLSANIADE